MIGIHGYETGTRQEPSWQSQEYCGKKEKKNYSVAVPGNVV
jgi:hypothetical protein